MAGSALQVPLAWWEVASVAVAAVAPAAAGSTAAAAAAAAALAAAWECAAAEADWLGDPGTERAGQRLQSHTRRRIPAEEGPAEEQLDAAGEWLRSRGR